MIFVVLLEKSIIYGKNCNDNALGSDDTCDLLNYFDCMNWSLSHGCL